MRVTSIERTRLVMDDPAPCALQLLTDVVKPVRE